MSRNRNLPLPLTLITAAAVGLTASHAQAAITGDTLTVIESLGLNFAVEAPGDTITFTSFASDLHTFSPATDPTPLDSLTQGQFATLYSDVSSFTGTTNLSLNVFGASTAGPTRYWRYQVFADGTTIRSADEGYDGNSSIEDHFAMYTLVPEPSSLALLGMGGLLIARRRRA